MALDISGVVPVLDEDSGAVYHYASTEEDFNSLPMKHVCKIDRGSNGLILLMKSTESPGVLMAAKNFLLNFTSDAKNEERKKIFLKETAALQNLSHKNIVKLYYSVMGPRRAMTFMDYYPGTSLYTQNLTQELVLKYFLNILDAVRFLHSKRVIHRDISLDNILEKDQDVFLTDFGLAERLEDGNDFISGRVGTIGYMAPEVFHSSRWSAYNGFKADSYSVGVYLFSLLLQVDPPSDDFSLFKLWPILERSPKFDSMNSALKDCARQLLTVDPEERVTVTSLHAGLCRRGFYNADGGAGGEDRMELGGQEVKDMEKPMVTFEGWETLGAEVDIYSEE